ncbi:MAG: hypothetical protein CVU47_03030 [Chloroflexi bacterium HGW-Chloroflexi-9]|nr:BON domain-containing protein [Dehalococcoidia bacterium]PKN82408.1 MAG: hypothetical protein CVU47_03030 [Chloroflexi bacterium HGW-Chloroflexi-9]
MTQQTMGSAGKASSGGNPLSNLWSMVMGFRGGDIGLTARANRRLRQSLGADAAGIHADGLNGSVALRGSVASKEIAKAAEDAARRTRGASAVLNFLEVR